MTVPIKALTIVGASCIAATILIYMLLVPGDMDFFIMSLVALILSEMMLFGGIATVLFLKNETNSVLMIAGSTSLICICSVALFATGLIFISASMAMLRVFLSICLLIILLYSVGLVVFFFIDKHLRKSESGEMQLVEANLARATRLKAAAECCTNPTLRNQLLRMSDDVCYSDGTVYVSEDAAMDKRIDALCNALKTDDVATAEKLTNDLIQIERDRKEKTALIRRGDM